MIGRVLGLIFVSALIPGYAQTSSSQITKTKALQNVRVSSVPGWFELVSDENKFRVLFPARPKIDNDVISMKGFKVANDSGKWAAFCSDLGRPAPDDEPALRNLYQQSIDSMTRNKTYLLASGDVFLNGRLGIDFRIRGLSHTSYTRAFAVGRRLYILSVEQKKTANSEPETPPEVQQFFDSFAYWD